MRTSRRSFLAVIAIAAICLSALAVAGDSTQFVSSSDQAAAETVLGPQWKQLSRRAGMIFSGTVLSTTAPQVRTDRIIPAVELSFRVERAIAGVSPGQVLTIHEWAGALSNLRPMRRGDRILLFLYPESRLGLTSPVGGSQGQIRLDASGQNVVDSNPLSPIRPAASFSLENKPTPNLPSANGPVGARNVTLAQLERAIRAARGE